MRINELLKFLLAIAVIVGLFAFKVGDLAGSIKQGLDLQGGTHIVLEAKDMPEHVVTDQDVEQVVKIMERRINEMGLTEPIIQREGSRRIIIELPGERDPEQAIKTIGKTAILQFKDEDGNVRLSGEDLATANSTIRARKNSAN